MASSFSTVTTTTTTPVPQILSRAAIPSLVQSLDASDVLECYHLTRHAPLQTNFWKHNKNNSTNTIITIPKSAIGLRYVVRGGGSNNRKKPNTLVGSLILEYGPQRSSSSVVVGGGGPTDNASQFVLQESTPVIAAAPPAHYISWQNEAQVYYVITNDEFLPEHDWNSAYYMASITGAVLEKLLYSAVDYVSVKRRYQPFVVVSKKKDNNPNDDKIVLKSSSSGDFLQYLWETLAVLGVELRPILPPPVRIARLHVSNIQKVAAGDVVQSVVAGSDNDDSNTDNNNNNNDNDSNQQQQQQQPLLVSQHASIIYGKLEKCIAAIATGDYSEYQDKETTTPTVAPTNDNMDNVTKKVLDDLADNDKGDENEGEDEEEEQDDDNDDAHEDDQDEGDTQEAVENPDVTTDNDNVDPDNPPRLRRVLEEPSLSDQNVPNVQTRYLKQHNKSDKAEPRDHVLDNDADVPDTDITSTTSSPSSAPTAPSVNEAEEANKAAQKAKEKAHEAKAAATTEAENKAADAAEAAANAAQKAADVTSQKQQETSQTNLLSGDGTLISSSVVTCFTNPQYDLVQDDGSALLYLYLDGATYYQLNLTAPYLDVATVDRPIPQPPLPTKSGGGDFIDWTLAIVTIGFLGVGIVLVFQRIGFKFLQPLYKMQKWFFSPTESGYDSEEENDVMQMGQGFEHAFGEDVIPLSMGGRRPKNSHQHSGNGMRKRGTRRQVVPIGGGESDHGLFVESNNGLHSDDDDDDDDHIGDVEMVGDVLTPASLRGRTLSSDGGLGGGSAMSRSSGHGKRLSSGGPIIMDLPERLARDPDLVDLPNLSSKSKVAVPVAIEHQRSGSTSRNASDDEGGSDDDDDSTSENSFT